jgi:ubiquinol-cytochrome c reductase iron-sulfur subunit
LSQIGKNPIAESHMSAAASVTVLLARGLSLAGSGYCAFSKCPGVRHDSCAFKSGFLVGTLIAAVDDTVANESIADLSRRKFLTRATIGVGVVGMMFTSIPFIESWLPSERARALGGPTTVDASKVEAGEMIVVTWRRKPIYIVRRTSQMLALLGNHDSRLKDPHSSDSQQPPYARNDVRARRLDLFVTIGICTHLGCLPKTRFKPGEPPLGADWPGGFFCPCHGSRFDLAGRVFDGSPASVNLVIPSYAFGNDHKLIIGVDKPGEATA